MPVRVSCANCACAGIVPMVCEALFKEIEAKRSSAKKDEEYQVTTDIATIFTDY